MGEYIIYNYITTNLINGKQYIGMHSTQDVDDGYLGSGSALFIAIRKYGKNNFIREILCFCANEDEAHANEEKFIAQYNTMRPYGYNLSPTGGMYKSGRHSEESKRKLSLKHTGKIVSQATIQKLIDRVKGVPLTDEHKRNISLGMKGHKSSPARLQKMHYKRSEQCILKHRQAQLGKPAPNKGKKWNLSQREKFGKPVLQYDLNMGFVREWASCVIAEQTLGYKHNVIRKSNNGVMHKCHGYIWMDKYQDKLSKVRVRNILQYSLDNKYCGEWDSSKTASNATNISVGAILSCIRGDTSTAGGFIWKKK